MMNGRPAGYSDEESDDDLFYSGDYKFSTHDSHEETSWEPLPEDVSKSNLDTQPKKSTRTSFVKPTSADHEVIKCAVIAGDSSQVRRWLEQGIPVDIKLDNGWTALMYAAHFAKANTLKVLLEHGADPNFQIDAFSPLLAVTANPETDTVDVDQSVSFLLQHGANINSSDRYKMTPLMFASREGRLETVKKLILAGANVNSIDYKNWTALTWSCYKGHGQVVRHLLENGADSLVVTVDGETAADVARMQNHEEIACLVENRFAKIQQNGTSPESRTNRDRLQPESIPAVNEFKVKYYGELEIVISGLGLQHLLPLLHEHNVDFMTFLRLDENDLDRLGISKVGERIKILDAIKQIHKREWERSSLPALHLKKHITCPDAVALLGNIGKQARYMQASIGYLKEKVKKQPEILELGQESEDIDSLLIQAREAHYRTTGLLKELRLTIHELEKLERGVEGKVTDTIVVKKSGTKIKAVTSAILLSLAAGVIIYSRK